MALALFGLTFNVLGGWRFALSAVVAGIVVFVLGSIPFSMGIIGGGDVKLLAACACVFGLAQILPLVLYTALIGGAVGVVALLLRRLGRIDKAARLPYAVAITGGVAWLELSLTLLPKLKLV